MVYEYSWSGIDRPVSAKDVGEHLRKLENEYGEVTKEIFLDSARPKNSKMHKLFEWDDAKAAEKYRLHQSNVIIASLRVTIKEEEHEPVKLRAFIQDREVSTGYLNIKRALSDDDKRGRIIEQAKKELIWFKEKYSAFSELSNVIDAIEGYLQTA